jgi:hypothetical protein
MKIPSSFIDMQTEGKILTLFGKLTKGMTIGQQILRTLLKKESTTSQTFSGRTLELLLLR